MSGANETIFRLFVAGTLALAVAGVSRAAEPVSIFAAGSLGSVLPELIAASNAPAGSAAVPTFGPAGVLSDRLRGDERADLFASADTAGPMAVAAKAANALVVPFARNRRCLLAPERLGLNGSNLLERMLAPDFRLAASMPGADPGGDYARAVFKRADMINLSRVPKRYSPPRPNCCWVVQVS